MKTFFLADTNHRTGIRSIGRIDERHLIHDGRAVYQPANGANVGPGKGWIVEDAGVFGFAGMQLFKKLFPGNAQCFGGAV